MARGHAEMLHFVLTQRVVNHRTKATANPTKDEALPRPQPDAALASVLPPLDDGILEPVVRREVDGLVAALPHHGRDDALVEGAESLLADDDHGGLDDVGVLPMPELGGIDHGIVLRLHPDLAHLGGRYDHDRLREARRQSGEERDGTGVLSGGEVALLIVRFAAVRADEGAEMFAVPLEADESDRHLGHYAGPYGRQALVEGGEALSGDDALGRAEGSEGSRYGSGLVRRNDPNLGGRWSARMARRGQVHSGFVTHRGRCRCCCSSSSSEAFDGNGRSGGGGGAVQSSGGFGETAADDSADHAGLVEGATGADRLDGLGLPTELHSGLDGVEGMTYRRFDEPRRTSRDEMHQRMLLLWSCRWSGRRRWRGIGLVVAGGGRHDYAYCRLIDD